MSQHGYHCRECDCVFLDGRLIERALGCLRDHDAEYAGARPAPVADVVVSRAGIMREIIQRHVAPPTGGPQADAALPKPRQHQATCRACGHPLSGGDHDQVFGSCEEPSADVADLLRRLDAQIRFAVEHPDNSEVRTSLLREARARIAQMAQEQENVLSSPMAAGLLVTLRAECESQHARAEQAEAQLREAQRERDQCLATAIEESVARDALLALVEQMKRLSADIDETLDWEAPISSASEVKARIDSCVAELEAALRR